MKKRSRHPIFKGDKCKVKYAASVKLIMPLNLSMSYKDMMNNVVNQLYIDFLRQISLDMSSHNGIIVFTLIWSNYHAQIAQCKATNTQEKWNAQSSSRIGHRPSFSGRRFFRYSGSAPGEVRDASASFSGGLASNSSIRDFWFFTPVLLQSTGCIRARGPGWFDPKKAWTQRGTQDVQGSYSLCYKSACRQPRTFRNDASAPRQRTFWIVRSSAEYRTSYATQRKKNVLISGSMPPSTLEHYENLRQEGLSMGCYHAKGWGTFARCGLLAWSLAWESPRVTPPATTLQSGTIVAISEYTNQPLIHVMTSMVLDLQQEVSYDF